MSPGVLGGWEKGDPLCRGIAVIALDQNHPRITRALPAGPVAPKPGGPALRTITVTGKHPEHGAGTAGPTT